MSDLNRRDFLKLSGAAAAGAVSLNAEGPPEGGRHVAEEQAREGLLAAPPIELVRIGMVGIGLQGGGSATVYRRAGCQCAKHQGAGSNFQGVQDFGIAHHWACLSINIGWVQKCLR